MNLILHSFHLPSQIVVLIVIFCFKVASATTFTLANRCSYTIWPGILCGAGSGGGLDSTGFELPSGWSRSFPAPPGWSGRFWGRTGCNFDPNSGQGTCQTGDCGSGRVECGANGATPPATLVEFTTAADSSKQDFYDVSLVDGYNLPVAVEAKGGSAGGCASTGCAVDLNQRCPSELRVGAGLACKSACEAFGKEEYCCSGAYAAPSTCKPSSYSQVFKSACPRSYSYAYDDATSTFTCVGADYTITFCPSSPRQKSASNSSPTAESSSPTTGNNSSNGSGNESTESGDMPSWFPDFFMGAASPRTLSPPAASLALCTFAIHFLSLYRH